METKHTPTPGPWHVAKHGPESVYPGDGGGIIARCYSKHRSRDEQAANARLIAAAPALLAALQQCEDLLSELADGGAENPELEMARKAIAIANGGAS